MPHTLVPILREYSVTRWPHCLQLAPVDKPVLAPARSGRLGRRDTHVATAVTS
jgi:hypothetical protein